MFFNRRREGEMIQEKKSFFAKLRRIRSENQNTITALGNTADEAV